MVGDGIFYRLFHPLPFVCQNVDNDGPFGVFKRFKYFDQFFDVVAIDWADVGKAILFKKGGGADQIFQRFSDFVALFGQHCAVARDF